MMHKLLKRGADYDAAETETGWSCAHFAAFRGNDTIAKILIDCGATLEHLEKRIGISPLHVTCREGHEEVAEALMSAGVNVDVRDARGETPLYYACRSNLVRSVKNLVRFGANVNARDKTRRTPLHEACACQSVRSLRFLLSSHASIYACDDEDNSPLHVASASSRLTESLRELLKFETGDKMLRQGWLNGQNIEGRTALHEACADNNFQGLEMLLKNGASDRVMDKTKRTCLHIASHKGSIECVRVLLRYSKTTLNELDENGFSALHLASQSGHTVVTQDLLKAGAEVDAKDLLGRTACWLASRHGHASTVQVLYGVGGADVNLGNIRGISPVHVAVLHLHDHVLKMLIEGNADLNIRTCNRQSVLHVLAGSCVVLKRRAKQIEISELLRKGMSCDSGSWKDSKGRRARDIAVVMGWSSRDAECVF